MTVLFAEPIYLWGLLLLPLLWVAYGVAHRTYVRRRVRFGEPEVLAQMGYPARFTRQHLKFGFLSLAMACVLVALARPLGGPTSESMAATGADVVVLLDLSNSMKAEDVHPNRLESAYAFLEQWLNRLRGERVGVLLFAGEPVVLCPLTIDYAAVRTFLEDARDSTLIRQGTSIGDAIRMALDRFLPEKEAKGAVGRALLILSDGEDHGSKPLEAADEARKRGVRIFTIGVGTSQGARIPIGINAFGKRIYKRYRGREVISRLDETLLRQLARRTGGEFWTLAQEPLQPLLARLRAMPGRRTTVAALQRRAEWFPLWVALTLGLLLIEGALAPRSPIRHRRSGRLHLRWSVHWKRGQATGKEP